MPSAAVEQVAADRVQVRVVRKTPQSHDRVDDREPRVWSGPEAHGDSPVHLDDRRRPDGGEHGVESAMRLQSVSSALRARAWHAGIPAWTV